MALLIGRSSFPDGPIFTRKSSEVVTDFLLKCAAYEEQCHILDVEMSEVVLTIKFEFETLNIPQLESSFVYSCLEQNGSVSFSLITVKCPDASYQFLAMKDLGRSLPLEHAPQLVSRVSKRGSVYDV